MWVKTEELLINANIFMIEEKHQSADDFFWIVVARVEELDYLIGKYKTLEEAQKVLEYCWDSLTNGVMCIDTSADFIDRYVLHKVTEAENFDVRR